MGTWKLEEIQTTKDIPLVQNPFERIIGQEEAVHMARLAAGQKRHLLLVGPPGTGKSMIAQAMASILPAPTQEVGVVHNEEKPERPIVEVRTAVEMEAQDKTTERLGTVISPFHVPSFVAERLGFRCTRCGALSDPHLSICPPCGAEKYLRQIHISVGEMYRDWSVHHPGQAQVSTTRKMPDGKEENVRYERTIEGKIRVLTSTDIRRMQELTRKTRRKILVPLQRSMFVQASGASETELLGDVQHDPYGGHPRLGTLPYLRVIPGAVHEAHEGVLFLDELSTLGYIQKFILTAMQERQFPIVGRNPSSTGASVRVDAVPCKFILVGSINITDLNSIVPPLRSRIRGDGYEILMRTSMPDSEENRAQIAQFIAQEIAKDGRVPAADREAVEEIIGEGRRIAQRVDNANGITLRLRNLAGIVKLAGDLAMMEKSELIVRKHVQQAIQNARPIEEQVREKYDSWWRAESADMGYKPPKAGPETA